MLRINEYPLPCEEEEGAPLRPRPRRLAGARKRAAGLDEVSGPSGPSFFPGPRRLAGARKRAAGLDEVGPQVPGSGAAGH
jgi:hypothetical protein